MAKEPIDDDLIDRERGVFTREDRQFLFDQEKYLAKQAKPRKSAHIRQKEIEERIDNVLLDIYLLYRELHSESNDQYDKPIDSVRLVIGHLFMGLRDCGLNDSDDEYAKDELRRYVLNNISWAYAQEGIAVPEAGFYVHTEETDGLDTVEERFKNDGNVSDAEVGMLLDAGRITVNEFEEHLSTRSDE
jgi:hypothetical protein